MVTKIKMDKEVKAPKAAKTPKATASTQSLSSFVKSICDIMRRTGARWQHETRTKLKNLIAQKQRRFPQDRRIIASWEVFTQGSTFRVTASATAKPL